jgi:putative two-component system response regulator
MSAQSNVVKKTRNMDIETNGQTPDDGRLFPESDRLTSGSPKSGSDDGSDNQDQSIITCQILIVDPSRSTRDQVRGILADLHHRIIEVESTEDALLALSRGPIDLILIDLHAPNIGAIAFCEIVRRTETTRFVPIFIQAASVDLDQEPRAFTAGVDEFLIAPLKPNALRARVHATLRLKSMMDSLDNSESVLFTLAKSVEDRDPDLGQHCQRLALMASAMGLALGLPEDDVRSLQRGGYLHDIGKIGIPDRILFKAGPLTPSEWEIMKSHSERGERICACMKSLASVLPIIRHHHEKFDGTGYPDGLKGAEIPLLARILQTVDIYDALTTERPYKRAYTPEEALAIMYEETKKGWRDPVLLDVFAELLPLFRHPALADTARLSLSNLSESLEAYRKNSLRQPAAAASNFNAQKI